MDIIIIQNRLINDDKRIDYDEITTYPCGKRAGILCKQELLLKVSRKC